MPMIFADAPLQSPLVSSNVQVILAFIILVLAGVVVVLWKDGRTKDRIIYNLQDKRLQDKIDTLDKYNEAMGETSRTVELLTTKLKAGG